jgi:hypothetical protein
VKKGRGTQPRRGWLWAAGLGVGLPVFVAIIGAFWVLRQYLWFDMGEHTATITINTLVAAGTLLGAFGAAAAAIAAVWIAVSAARREDQIRHDQVRPIMVFHIAALPTEHGARLAFSVSNHGERPALGIRLALVTMNPPTLYFFPKAYRTILDPAEFPLTKPTDAVRDSTDRYVSTRPPKDLHLFCIYQDVIGGWWLSRTPILDIDWKTPPKPGEFYPLETASTDRLSDEDAEQWRRGGRNFSNVDETDAEGSDSSPREEASSAPLPSA